MLRRGMSFLESSFGLIIKRRTIPLKPGKGHKQLTREGMRNRQRTCNYATVRWDFRRSKA